MKKIFTIAALLCAGVAAQAQYVKPALNPETFNYDQFDWDHAHNFVIIGACETVVAEMEKITDHGIYKDIRPDGETNFFYVWSDTYEGADGTGFNSFGVEEDHTALKVTNVGWSGAGFNHGTFDWRFLTDDFILHFGWKGKHAEGTCIGLGGSKWSIGDKPFVDGNVTLTNLGTWSEDGEWYYFDIPVSVIRQIAKEQLGIVDIFDHIDANNGKHLTPDAYDGNSLWMLSGGTTGQEVHIDNMFLYTKEPIDVGGGVGPEPTEFSRFDVNRDGQVSAVDVSEVVNYLAGLTTE